MLHQALSEMARDSKAKEQSVLFGAKCLSCNRNFDDTVTTAGTVDLHGEKQRAQLLAEVQRAIASPCSDADAVRMLTVKVGRSGQVAGRDGGSGYEGRSAVFGCAVDDVQVLRAPRSSSVATPRVGKAR